MGPLTKLLKKHQRIALDSCVWIYHFEAHPVFSKPVGQILSAVAKGQCQAVVSELVLLELVTGPLKLGRQDVADEYETLLANFPNLEFVPVSRDILLEAAQIRALYGLRTPDAIMLATARDRGATLVLTNDKTWARYPDIAVASLGELA